MFSPPTRLVRTEQTKLFKLCMPLGTCILNVMQLPSHIACSWDPQNLNLECGIFRLTTGLTRTTDSRHVPSVVDVYDMVKCLSNRTN